MSRRTPSSSSLPSSHNDRDNYNADESDDEQIFFEMESPKETNDKNNSSDNNNSEQQLIVEKFLGRKYIQQQDNNNTTIQELFFVKWKNMSYLHASWESRTDIEQVDVNAKTKLKRFLQTPQLPGIIGEPPKPSKNDIENLDESEVALLGNVDEEEVVYFNPEMLEIHRIISCDHVNFSHAKARKPSDLIQNRISRKRKSSDHSEDGLAYEDLSLSEVRYLVKWRGLPYDECSWERWDEIKSFYREIWIFC